MFLRPTVSRPAYRRRLADIIIGATVERSKELVARVKHTRRRWARQEGKPVPLVVGDLGIDLLCRRMPVAIQALRRKLELDPAYPRYILTELGVGYLLETRTHSEVGAQATS
jgi:hypothetical protein